MDSFVVIPSRSGVKNKGMWNLAGHPLVEWVLKQTDPFYGCVTSDQPEVLNLTYTYMKIPVVRPPNLRDEGPGMLEDSVIHALDELGAEDHDIVHLCQPTSPFVSVAWINTADDVLRDGKYNSAQTIVKIPHNHHEINQRRLHGNNVIFVHENDRRSCVSKQLKNQRWAFGNLVSTKVGALRKERWLFVEPSYGIAINRFSALDIDDVYDLEVAESYLEYGCVFNPFKAVKS